MQNTLGCGIQTVGTQRKKNLVKEPRVWGEQSVRHPPKCPEQPSNCDSLATSQEESLSSQKDAGKQISQKKTAEKPRQTRKSKLERNQKLNQKEGQQINN